MGVASSRNQLTLTYFTKILRFYIVGLWPIKVAWWQLIPMTIECWMWMNRCIHISSTHTHKLYPSFANCKLNNFAECELNCKVLLLWNKPYKKPNDHLLKYEWGRFAPLFIWSLVWTIVVYFVQEWIG